MDHGSAQPGGPIAHAQRVAGAHGTMPRYKAPRAVTLTCAAGGQEHKYGANTDMGITGNVLFLFF